MKKQIMVDACFCSKCEEKCEKTKLHAFTDNPANMHTGDAYYCHPCAIKAFEDNDPLYMAYVAIAELRQKGEDMWTEHLKERVKAVKELKKIKGEFKL